MVKYMNLNALLFTVVAVMTSSNANLIRRGSDACPMATPDDLQKKWDMVYPADIPTPKITTLPNGVKKIETTSFLQNSQKYFKWNTLSSQGSTSSSMSQIDFHLEPTEQNGGKPLTRTLVTMTLADKDQTKVHYVLPGGSFKEYNCHGLYSFASVLPAKIYFQSEIV